MKRRLFVLAVLIFFFSILLFPGAAFAGASRGILLWFDTVLPTLLPFMIAAGLMVRTNAVDLHLPAGGRLCLGRVLQVSAVRGFCGDIAGIPLRLSHGGQGDGRPAAGRGGSCREEAGYLLSFCNNTSPMFALSAMWSMRFIGRKALVCGPSVAAPLPRPAPVQPPLLPEMPGEMGSRPKDAAGTGPQVLPNQGTPPSPPAWWTPA